MKRRSPALSSSGGPLLLSSSFPLSDCSFSTDDDNDTEVEAVDVDTELNLVTECWVEPQSGLVMNCPEQRRYFQGLKYQEIPQAVRAALPAEAGPTPPLLRVVLAVL